MATEKPVVDEEKGQKKKKKLGRGTCVLVPPTMNGTAAAGQSSRLQIAVTSEVRYRCSPSQAGRGWLFPARYFALGVKDHSGNQKLTYGPQRDMPTPCQATAAAQFAAPWPAFTQHPVWHLKPGTPGLSAPRYGPPRALISSHAIPSPVEEGERPAPEPFIWEIGHAAPSATASEMLNRCSQGQRPNQRGRPNYGKYWMSHVRRMLQANHG